MEQNERKVPLSREALHPDVVKRLFLMQPDNRLTPAQMVRKDLFPRWEMIQPAYGNPIERENELLSGILAEHAKRTDGHPEP